MREQSRTHVVMILLILCLALGVGCSDEAPTSIADSKVAEMEIADPGLLRTIMVDLGIDMSEISRGLWLDDLSLVATAAKSVAEHPHVSDEERARIQVVLDANFADFIQSDRRVHDAAVRLSTAAASGDLTATLNHLAELQGGCVACHQDFRERLR